MYNKVKNIIWAAFIFLAIINIFIFLKSITLSSEISFFETELRNIHQENLELEKKAVSFDSLQYAASMAAVLNYTKKSQPIYIENDKYALNK